MAKFTPDTPPAEQFSGDGPDYTEPTPEPVRPKGKGGKLLPWLVAIAGALCAIGAILLWMGEKDSLDRQITSLEARNRSLTREVESLTAQRDELDLEVSGLESDKQSLEEQMGEVESQMEELTGSNADMAGDLEQLAGAAENYGAIVEFLQSGTAGYASSNFYCDEKIVALSAGESVTLNVSVGWDDVTVSLNTSGGSAEVHWASDTFEDVAPVEIAAQSAGITTITFTNNVNDETFQVLVLVAE